MNSLPSSIAKAIEALSDLPGIGSRSAERLVFNLLRNESGLDQKISKAIGELKTNVHECQKCFHYCESEICEICQDPGREAKTICVVESPMDILAIERTHEYKGLFHVLHGIISPLQKVRPEDTRTQELFERVKANPEVEEIIIALSGSIESDATALYITENLKSLGYNKKISRLARGIPTGGDLDYLDTGTIGRAILDRREF